MLLVSRGNKKTSSSDYSKLSATATYLNLLSKLCFMVFRAKIKSIKVVEQSSRWEREFQMASKYPRMRCWLFSVYLILEMPT